MAKIPDIAPFREKLAELDAHMSDPNFYSDQRRAAEVSREHQHVSGLVEKFEAFNAVQSQIMENQSLLDDRELEQELREMARRSGVITGAITRARNCCTTCNDSWSNRQSQFRV